jgi:hypothetical protein
VGFQPSKPDQEFAAFILKRMEEEGLSRRQLAAKARLHHNLVARTLALKRGAMLSEVRALESVLGRAPQSGGHVVSAHSAKGTASDNDVEAALVRFAKRQLGQELVSQLPRVSLRLARPGHAPTAEEWDAAIETLFAVAGKGGGAAGK